MDAPHREAIIESALSALDERYIVPDTARRMSWWVGARAWFGRYDAVVNPVELARLLTDDLRDVSHDLHLSVRYIARAIPPVQAPPASLPGAPAPSSRPVSLDEARGFGFAHVEQLAGNIGYVELRGFDGRPEVAQATATVMSHLAM